MIRHASPSALDKENWSLSHKVDIDALRLALAPQELADSEAPNNYIYYSTTQSKLAYKDSGGVVHVLY